MSKTNAGFYDFGSRSPREELTVYEPDDGDVSVTSSSAGNTKSLKIVVAVLAVVAGLGILANAVSIPLIITRGGSSSEIIKTEEDNSDGVTTPSETNTKQGITKPTTTEMPPLVRTATTVSYTLYLNDFTETTTETEAADYYLFVATTPDRSLLDASITWVSVQSLDPPFAYLALQCTDFFANKGCFTTSGRQSQAGPSEVDRVQVKIGTEICDQTDNGLVCNGPLTPDYTYYFILQRKSGETAQDTGFTKFKTAVLGTWLTWSGWSECDQSCDGGVKRQRRECRHDTGEDASCEGLASKSTSCNTKPCPFLLSSGSWFSWTPWTECTVTCGGGEHIRSRQCDKGDKDLDCLGDNSQSLDCNTWQCPDCSRVCLSGSLSPSCTHCECSGQHSGVVQSVTGLVLSGVKVSLKEAPSQILETTTMNGEFTLSSLCISHELLFEKEGYSAESYEADQLPSIVTLKEHGSLLMVVHPTSKQCLVGDDAMFCCAATGNPLPRFYEWFKDGIQIPGESGSTLTLASVSHNSTGAYRCRASTVSKGIYSSEAMLVVRESAEDFCPQLIESKYQQLPTGCTYNGQHVINVGTCARGRCRGDIVNKESCDNQEVIFCCTATQFEKLDIKCDDFTLTLYKTAACGCSKCTTPVIDIEGFVLDDTRSPIENIEIYYNNTKVTMTGSNGHFYFSISSGTLRASITAKAPDGLGYTDGASVLTFSEDANGVFYIILRMVKVTLLNPIDSTSNQTILLTGGQTMLEVHLPADSYYDETGNFYSGLVHPQVSVIDPADVEGMKSAPGDFLSIDDMGEPQLLKTFGMMWISLQSSDGVKLQLVADVTLLIPESVLEHIDARDTPDAASPLSEFKLSSFNEVSGMWDEISAIQKEAGENLNTRKRRQVSSYFVNLRGISTRPRWLSINRVFRTVCHSKVRAFQTANFLEAEQLPQVDELFAYVQNNDGGGTVSYSRNIVRGSNEKNGYCLIHPCDKAPADKLGFRGYIYASKAGKNLMPAVNMTGLGELETSLDYKALHGKLEVNFDLTKASDGSGPFYDWEKDWLYSPSCTSAPFSDRHFQFYLQEEDQCYQFQKFSFKDELTPYCQSHFYKSWYSAIEYHRQEFTTCYIKVNIAHYTSSTKVQAISRIGTFRYESRLDEIQPGDNYGLYENCTKGGIVCMKIKPPGLRGCSTNDIHDKTDVYTVVSILARDRQTGVLLKVTEVESNLSGNHQILQQEAGFTFQMESSDSTGGIFCETRQASSSTQSDIDAFASCIAAGETEYAVEFGSEVIKPTEEPLATTQPSGDSTLSEFDGTTTEEK